jgi:hypothetical protein
MGGVTLLVIGGALYFLRSNEESSSSQAETNQVPVTQPKEEV